MWVAAVARSAGLVCFHDVYLGLTRALPKPLTSQRNPYKNPVHPAGFAAAHSGKPPAYRGDWLILLEAAPQLPKDNHQNTLSPLAGKAKPTACNFHYFRVSTLSSIMRRYNCAGGLAMKDSSLIPVERIEKAIYLIRGEKVMLDSDLATLYGVETKAVNRAAKRNLKRFPPDFMFQLTAEESAALRYQIGTSKDGRGG